MSARIAAFCLLSGMVVVLTADTMMGNLGLSDVSLPQLVRFKTLPASSRQALENGKDNEAITIARAAVLKQPFSVEALTSLALSSAVSKPEMSSQALAQAASFGWRNVAVQAIVIKSAALENNWNGVAPRLVALSNLNKLDALDPSVFVTANAGTYASKIAPAFAQNGIAWFRFADWLKDNGAENERASLLAQTPPYNRESDCIQLGQTARKLVSEDRVNMAADLIHSRCQGYLTPASGAITIDQHFGDSRRGPFEWQLAPEPGVSVRIGTSVGKIAVEVENVDPVQRVIASKILSKHDHRTKFRALFRLSDLNVPHRSIMPLSFECIGSKFLTASSGPVSGALYTSPCKFYRVKLSLPQGRFQLHVDEHGFQAN